MQSNDQLSCPGLVMCTTQACKSQRTLPVRACSCNVCTPTLQCEALSQTALHLHASMTGLTLCPSQTQMRPSKTQVCQRDRSAKAHKTELLLVYGLTGLMCALSWYLRQAKPHPRQITWPRATQLQCRGLKITSNWTSSRCRPWLHRRQLGHR